MAAGRDGEVGLLSAARRERAGPGPAPRTGAAAQRIATLYPAAATGHALEAAALLSLGRSQEAREALILARGAHWEDGAEPQRRAVEDLLRAFGRADSAR